MSKPDIELKLTIGQWACISDALKSYASTVQKENPRYDVKYTEKLLDYIYKEFDNYMELQNEE